MILKVKEKIKAGLDKGLGHILGTGLLNKIIAFFANVCIVRILSRDAYGVFGYADNITNFFLLTSGLGMINGVMQFGSENRPQDEKNAYFKYGLRFGVGFNLILSVTIVLYAIFVPISIKASRPYIIMLALLPLTNYLFTFFSTVLRCQKENKLYARVVNLNSFVYAITAVLGAFFFEIKGLVFSLYIANLVSAAAGLALTRYSSEIGISKYKLSAVQKKRIVSYSAISCVNTAVANLLYLLDVFILGVFVKDASVIAGYKVAMTIPTALLFIPQGINLFVYPYFAENNDNYEMIKKHTNKLLQVSIVSNACIVAILVGFAPNIIRLIWGVKFIDAALLLRILSINYFISATFRITAGNVLATLRKVKASMYVSVFSGVANIFFDIIFISKWGATGAALATLTVMIISSGLLVPVMYRAINKLKKVN